MMHRKDTTQQSGFTLIEALVGIAMLLLAIIGPMAIAQSGLQNSIFAKDQIVAFYIAQEGVELVRSLRDENALADNSWLTGIPAQSGEICHSSGAGCGIDPENMNFINCANNGGTACVLYYHASGLAPGGQRGIYGHTVSGGQPTVFSRSIKVTVLPGNKEATIDSTATWLSRGTSKSITVQSRIFDQYDSLW
jgi:type II secretory pathway pseudopilin PulG